MGSIPFASVKPILPTLAAVLFAVSAGGATFFLNSVTGSDANTSAQAQSTATPWAHCPGMSGETGSGNWQLQAGSPAIGARANPSAVFNPDLDGKNRSAPWSIGAYAAPALADLGSVLGGRVAISGGLTLR